MLTAAPAPAPAPASSATIARVNGVPLHEPGEPLAIDALRQRACTELLRQQAAALGITAPTPQEAIEALLEHELAVPEPDELACRRHFEARASRFAHGERLALRHILFAVTPGVDVAALRARAEALLLELRCADPGSDAFAQAARRWSNCPSGADGGDLGWLRREDCAPEFAEAVFGQTVRGVLPRLVHSRFGLHVVEVADRQAGTAAAFDEVREAVALQLHQFAWAQAVRQYLRMLAGAATLEHVDLEAGDTPLVQ